MRDADQYLAYFSIYNNYMNNLNPESTHLPESFFKEILTIYNKFTDATDELTIKFNEDISNVINKLFDLLKDFEDESDNAGNILEGIRLVVHYLQAYEQGLEPILGRDER